MNQKDNDKLPQLFYWISDNRESWHKLCVEPDIEKEDFIDILQSLQEAGLYQIALVLLATTYHRRYLNSTLKDIMFHWCEEHMTAGAIDNFIDLLLEKLK